MFKREDEWFPGFIKVTFDREGDKGWTSLLKASPDTVRLYSGSFTLEDFWIWIKQLIRNYKLIIGDTTNVLNFKDVEFKEKGSISSTDWFYIVPDYPADYRLLKLYPSFFSSYVRRLRMEGKAYERIDEIIKEKFNLQVEGGSIIKYGYIFFSFPKFHWRFKEITRTEGMWDVVLESASNFQISDYQLFYILKDKENNILERGSLEGSELAEKNSISVPLDTSEIICYLDYNDETVDWFKKKKEDVKTDLFRIAISTVNDTLDSSDRLQTNALDELISFIQQHIILMDIEEAVRTWFSPFNPSDVDKRLSSLFKLALRYESFFKKLHEQNSNPQIRIDFENLSSKTLGSILNQNWNIFSSEAWFHDYKIVKTLDPTLNINIRSLKKANTHQEFHDNWKILIDNRFNLNRNLRRLLLISLCRNLQAHLTWSSIVWTAYEPYNITIRMILEMYLISWKCAV